VREHVDVVTLEVLGPEPLARLPACHYFGMGGGIVGLHHEVRALGDDLAAARDHAREGPSAIFDVLESQLDSALDEMHAMFPLWYLRDTETARENSRRRSDGANFFQRLPRGR
jgi:hypothetical protein